MRPSSHRQLKQSRRRSRRGLTLLELILALSLTVLLLMTIAMAIQMHFRMLDLRRTNVDEAVHVRSVLNNFAKDLTPVMLYTPPDTSGLDALAGTTATAAANLVSGATGDENLGALLGGAASGAGNQGTQGGGSGQGGATGGGQTGGGTPPTGNSGAGQAGGGAASNQGGASPAGGASKTSTSGNTGAAGAAGAAAAALGGAVASGETGTEPAASTAAPVSVVGLYGSATELKFDVSKLPRLDQYDALYSATGDTAATDIPSDVKTVIYFLASADTPLDPTLLGPQQGVQPAAGGMGKGLMRREIDRAVKNFAESSGDTASLYDGARLVSDKVVGLAFQYFDGTAWLPDWDSDSLGGLPKAVEIQLTVQPTYGMTEDEIAELAPEELPPTKTYRHVVRIPTSNPAPPPPATEETTDPAAASGTAAPPSSGASGTSPQGAAP
jgi:hypothetical protein